MKNKKKLLIFSIAGIICVMVTVLAFTYAYYFGIINGNTTEESVGAVIVNKSLEYKYLSSVETSVIAPGYEKVEYFTVKNTGESKINYHIYLDDVQNSFTRKEDIKYILYRKSGNNSITDKEYFSDCVKVAEGFFPAVDAYIKTDEILETSSSYYTYALKTVYNDSIYNQDQDQGKSFSSKIQIHSEIENKYTEGTLAYAIINNSLHISDEEKNNGYAEFTVPTPTKVAEQINAQNESVLSVANDNNGVSYFFRGNVKNNYLTFNNMCFRIVRIQGNGTVKLILEDKTQACSSTMSSDWSMGDANYGFTSIDNARIANFKNPTVNIASALLTRLDSTLTTGGWDFSKIVQDNWCLGNVNDAYSENGNLLDLSLDAARLTKEQFYYMTGVRLYGYGEGKYASFICKSNEDTWNAYFGALTADEVVFAGYKAEADNFSNYLDSFYPLPSSSWWTLSLALYYPSLLENVLSRDNAFLVTGTALIPDNVDLEVQSRLALTLKANLPLLSGDGTINSPYRID